MPSTTRWRRIRRAESEYSDSTVDLLEQNYRRLRAARPTGTAIRLRGTSIWLAIEREAANILRAISHRTSKTNDEPLRVCYFGTYRAEYSRNKIMIEALRRAGVEVLECHETLWRDIEDRVQMASGGWKNLEFWRRVGTAYLNLLRRYPKMPDHDVLVVGYPGQFDVYLARVLAFMRGKPLAWDVFMSIYLIALERGLDKRSPFTIDWLRRIERLALRLPDVLVHDTTEYATWLSETHDLSPERFHLVPTGADDRVYHPRTVQRDQHGPFTVLYYGSFIPNHGVRYIVEAANHLRADHQTRFELIGDGPDRARAEAQVAEYGLENVEFRNWLSPPELVERATQADACLGAFGTTPQSLMTVQNKIYEGLAMAVPVITGDAKEIRRALTHGEHVYLCPRENGEALADAVRALRGDAELRQRLASRGHAAFLERYALDRLGERYREHLARTVSAR